MDGDRKNCHPWIDYTSATEKPHCKTHLTNFQIQFFFRFRSSWKYTSRHDDKRSGTFATALTLGPNRSPSRLVVQPRNRPSTTAPIAYFGRVIFRQSPYDVTRDKSKNGYPQNLSRAHNNKPTQNGRKLIEIPI